MTENTRLGGIKQEFQEFKHNFQVMISDWRVDMERKFEKTNERLQELNDHLKTNIVDQMNESVMSIKDTITTIFIAQRVIKSNCSRKRSLKLEFLVMNLSNIQGEIILKLGHPSTNPWWKIKGESYWSFRCNEYCNYEEWCWRRSEMMFKKYYYPVCE